MSSSSNVQVRIRSMEERFPSAVRQEVLRPAAAKLVGIIVLRTGQGVDVNGADFAPYAKEYARLKTAAGRSARPDLRLGGDMMTSLVVLQATPDLALIGFQGSSTPVQFKRLRTETGAPSKGRKGNSGRRLTHTLSRSTSKSATPVANSLKAKANNERRHFFGYSPEERREVIAEAKRAFRQRVTT